MGYFGPQNFTAETRVILALFVIEGFHIDRECWCFRGLTAEIAAHLLTQLPAYFHGERQNDGPTFGSLVKVATAYEGTLLEGYVVGPSRDDERVTLTGIWIPASLVDQALGDLDTATPPDELDWCKIYGKSFRRAWWD